MEDNNYRDDFELFLKENADEFRMVPSRRVWYSLYNNMHPSKRWPSMAVCLLILTAVLYIGIENNNSLSNAARKNAAENFTAKLTDRTFENNSTFLPPFVVNNVQAKKRINVTAFDKYDNTQRDDVALLVTSPSVAEEPFLNEDIETYPTNVINTNSNILVSNNNQLPNQYSTNNKLKTKTIANNNVDGNYFLKAETNTIAIVEAEASETDNGTAQLNEKKLSKNADNINDPNNALSNIEKSWTEDYAFRNKPAINKLKQNGSISYYITPSLGYRIFGKRDYVKRSMSNVNGFSNSSLTGDRKLNDEEALSFEIGAAFQYTVSKKVRIKTGIQGNYTNYISNVTALGHPSQITLDVSNATPQYAASNYSSASGNSRLNKTTLQVSLPIGADVKISGNDKINWYVGATLQPTYILRGSGYVLSSDAGHYASEPSLLRKLNLNSSIESFISFKPSPGVTMMVGPQLRYQLFSSFKNNYNYSEKLYNVGIKLGISTTF